MMLYSPSVGRLTEHEDLGLNDQGKHMAKCTESGEIHEIISQARRSILEAKKAERYKERTFNDLMDSVKKEQNSSQ